VLVLARFTGVWVFGFFGGGDLWAFLICF